MDQEHTRLRNLLLEGAGSESSGMADEKYFDSLRARSASAPIGEE